MLLTAMPVAAQIGNGSFETPPLPVGGVQFFGNGATIGPWTVVGAPGNVGTVANGFSFGGVTFNAQDGNQFLDLTGSSNSNTGVEQTVTTLPGATYNLSFYVGNVNDPAAGLGTTSTVQVFVNGTQLADAVNSSGNATGVTWLPFTRAFTASGPSTTIRFLNGDPSNDTANGLDNVTLTAAAVTTPEPGSITLLATGIVGLVAATRRRRRA
jgi:hypothetical protein